MSASFTPINVRDSKALDPPFIRGQIHTSSSKSPEGRVCQRCEQFKVFSEFYRNRSKPDGHESHCKACVLAKKARSKVIKGGPIELDLELKPSIHFDEGLGVMLDIICREIVDGA